MVSYTYRYITSDLFQDFLYSLHYFNWGIAIFVLNFFVAIYPTSSKNNKRENPVNVGARTNVYAFVSCNDIFNQIKNDNFFDISQKQRVNFSNSTGHGHEMIRASFLILRYYNLVNMRSNISQNRGIQIKNSIIILLSYKRCIVNILPELNTNNISKKAIHILSKPMMTLHYLK